MGSASVWKKNEGASDVFVFCVFPRGYSFLGNPRTLHTCYADDVMVYVCQIDLASRASQK